MADEVTFQMASIKPYKMKNGINKNVSECEILLISQSKTEIDPEYFTTKSLENLAPAPNDKSSSYIFCKNDSAKCFHSINRILYIRKIPFNVASNISSEKKTALQVFCF